MLASIILMRVGSRQFGDAEMARIDCSEKSKLWACNFDSECSAYMPRAFLGRSDEILARIPSPLD
jgi:hypothetical protein